MSNKAIYNIIENGTKNHFISYWGANALSPLLRLLQAKEWQQQLPDHPRIAHIFEHLDYSGAYVNPCKDDADMFCSRIDEIVMPEYLKSYMEKSEIEMQITLNLDGNECLLEYNRNCPWYASMQNYIIPIDGGLHNAKKMLAYAEKNNINDFGQLLSIYNKASGLEAALQDARNNQKIKEFLHSEEATEARRLYIQNFETDERTDVMKPENASKIEYEFVEAAGQTVLFTNCRIDRNTVPEGYYCYDLRHGDDDSIPLTVENTVAVNYFGSVLCKQPFDFGDKDYIELNDGINFLGGYGIRLTDIAPDEDFTFKNKDKVKVLIVEPEKAPYVAEIKNDYKSLQDVVGGCFEFVGLDNNTFLVCNDEGKLIGLPGNRKVNNDIIAGTFFLCSVDSHGNTISLPDRLIEKYAKQFAQPEHYTTAEVKGSINYTITCGSKEDFMRILFGDSVVNIDDNEMEK